MCVLGLFFKKLAYGMYFDKFTFTLCVLQLVKAYFTYVPNTLLQLCLLSASDQKNSSIYKFLDSTSKHHQNIQLSAFKAHQGPQLQKA